MIPYPRRTRARHRGVVGCRQLDETDREAAATARWAMARLPRAGYRSSSAVKNGAQTRSGDGFVSRLTTISRVIDTSTPGITM